MQVNRRTLSCGIPKEVLFLSVDIPGPPMKERKEITLPHLSEPLHVKKVNTSSLSKILRGNVYVISKNQYDALQDGFKEEKRLCVQNRRNER